MSQQPPQPWSPTTVIRFERSIPTSTGTARIITDAGPAYIKAMGNPQGPHALACELIGTQLARWFGLPTPDFHIITLDEVDEIPFARGGYAAPGPAFVSRAVMGDPWGGDERQLALLDNPDDLTRLVVLDTWTLNCDRYPPYDPRNPVPESELPRLPNYDNVFLTAEGAAAGRFRLLALDHGHCFTCGRDLTPGTATIDRVKDERVYGLFPAFVRFMKQNVARDAGKRLGEVSRQVVQTCIDAVPREWEVSAPARDALATLIYERARFLADRIVDLLAPLCWAQLDLDFGEDGGDR